MAYIATTISIYIYIASYSSLACRFFCCQAKEKNKTIFSMVVKILWCMRLHKHIYLCAANYVCMVYLLTVKYLSNTVADCSCVELMSAAIGLIDMSITARPM